VGKSTIFNALTACKAEVAGYPFTTINPNAGIVPVPDPRLETLGQLLQPPKLTPATIEFVDIAGLIQGASQGEGLGNQFLAHIRDVDLLVHVVRGFEAPDIPHITSTWTRCGMSTSSTPNFSWRTWNYRRHLLKTKRPPNREINPPAPAFPAPGGLLDQGRWAAAFSIGAAEQALLAEVPADPETLCFSCAILVSRSGAGGSNPSSPGKARPGTPDPAYSYYR
jgi:hypothetical protein